MPPNQRGLLQFGSRRRLVDLWYVTQTLTADLFPDAHLAALAMEHGLEVCSADADFASFPGLRWRNPLLAPAG